MSSLALRSSFSKALRSWREQISGTFGRMESPSDHSTTTGRSGRLSR
jgi:hypothetical protein